MIRLISAAVCIICIWAIIFEVFPDTEWGFIEALVTMYVLVVAIFVFVFTGPVHK